MPDQALRKIGKLAPKVVQLLKAGAGRMFDGLCWSYLPPLMVYFAAGVSGFTGIVESFFVKEHLGLTPAFLAGLGFWAGLPWALKMPLGHLVDYYWGWKSLLVYLGALLMGLSLLIMVGLTGYTERMASFLSVDAWYVLSALLAPIGYVLQDVVADAMTLEAVPLRRPDGRAYSDKEMQRMHVTMQTLGRIAIVGGGAVVAGAGGWLATVFSYEDMYWISLLIPILSVCGVVLAGWMRHRNAHRTPAEATSRTRPRPVTIDREKPLKLNKRILLGSVVFAALTLAIGLSALPMKKELVFIGSLAVVVYLMRQLLGGMAWNKCNEIIGIAVIIFVFRAMPSAGAGAGWWQMDVLGFDEAFLGTLRQVSAILAIVGMLALRGWMGRRPVPYLVVFLSLYGAVMMLPFIGMVYGLHEWTQTHFGFGARTIAVIDTMADSPIGQVAMIPMLAWIAREAPVGSKATFFAVMAAFTNLALSAGQLGSQYLNRIFVIQRGQYDQLGPLMVTTGLLGLTVPIITVLFFHLRSKSRQQKVADHHKPYSDFGIEKRPANAGRVLCPEAISSRRLNRKRAADPTNEGICIGNSL